MSRPVPEAALALIRQFEGLRLRAYLDYAGRVTIGYGHTGEHRARPLVLGLEIDAETAEALLAVDVEAVARQIEEANHVPLTDGQFGALVSCAYNLGVGQLKRSKLWRLLQQGKYREAAPQFDRWTKAGRPLKVLPGLVKRRAAERAMFEGKRLRNA